MNLIEIMKASKPGDKLSYSKKPGIIYTKGMSTIFLDNMEINAWSFLDSGWKIIPPESKVMTAEEWIHKKKLEKVPGWLAWSDQAIEEAFRAGVLRGKFELFLSLKEDIHSSFHSTLDKFDPRK